MSQDDEFVGANDVLPVGAKDFSPKRAKDDSPLQTQPKRNRRSIRLKNYDYAQAGFYFVTVCTHQKACLFGAIRNGAMVKNALGRIVECCWNEIPAHFPNVESDAFVVMPNHVHGILVINVGENDCSWGVRAKNLSPVQAKNFSPLQTASTVVDVYHRPRGTSKTLGSIIRGFKIGVSKWAKGNTQIGTVWQRNYWEHIVRNEQQLSLIREYIFNNPAQWELDSLHINNRCTGRGEKSFAPTPCEKP
ncbi:transposase [Methylomonas sp. EFPC3]|uniref:transposase n=1 Tax=Methylomonas sp. EFPC3 TaxID=3021710 RepID=UPI002417B575|nr:transposase [Methylomonas sp. EFPC3]WFP49393.1 transposase [Methylomonas sp. EFPC3]